MWQVLKTEICYYKYLFIFGVLFVLIVNIKRIFFDAAPNINVVSELGLAWINISILVFFLYLFSYRKSWRIRIHTVIPVPVSKVGFSRILLFTGFWFFIILILLISHIVSFNSLPSGNRVKEIISLLGAAFIINSTPFIYQNLYNKDNREIKLLLAVWFGIIMSLYISVVFIYAVAGTSTGFTGLSSFREMMRQFISSTLGSLVIFIVGVILLVTSQITFNWRKSYLE